MVNKRFSKPKSRGGNAVGTDSLWHEGFMGKISIPCQIPYSWGSYQQNWKSTV